MSASGQTRQVCTFYLGDYLFGVEVARVQEVIRYQPVTKVPLAPPEVRGLINLRGQIVTALDLRRRLDMPEFVSEDLPINVVVTTADGPVSLVADRVGDVLDLPESSFEALPENVQGPTRQMVSSVVKLERQLLLVLDAEKTVTLV